MFKKSHLANTQYRKLLIKNLQYMPKCLVLQNKMVVVAQLVRVLVCGAEGRGFEPHQPPQFLNALNQQLIDDIVISTLINV